MNVLNIRRKSNFEALNFWYPKGGLQSLWDAILAKAGEQCKLMIDHKVIELKSNGSVIESIVCSTEGGVKEIKISEKDFVLSTLPITHTINMLGHCLSDNLKENSENLIKLNDLILVFLYIDVDQLMEDSWVFIPEEKYIFHRISEQNSFDPEMVNGGSILCCEVLVKENDIQNSWSNQKFLNAVIADLEMLELKKFNIVDAKVVRLNSSYPVLKIGYQENLENVLNELDKIENFKSIGRQGSFNYIGTLDAMDIGYGSSELVAKRLRKHWKAERLRTSFTLF